MSYLNGSLGADAEVGGSAKSGGHGEGVADQVLPFLGLQAVGSLERNDGAGLLQNIEDILIILG